ncbi:MAG: N-acetylmuramoyl-L-alanine amidase [Prevotellaceae bacterium]|jgi:N-acetylmuramoyl-L-alanine amidase|nr:N-acetylmuramoyl-L-alanine amidase [Prevotellaceae bacterium]
MRILQIIIIFLYLINTNIFAQTQTDKPEQGEGVYQFLKRNGCDVKENYDKFLELNKGKFGKNNSLLHGVSYVLPNIEDSKKTDKKKGQNELFGEKYAEYEIKSNALQGAVLYLSSGHGGPDPGAQGTIDGHTLSEDEYAYDITLRLARRLLEEGAEVYMIIQDKTDGIRDSSYLSSNKTETCMGEVIPLSQAKRLQQRTQKINELHKKLKPDYARALFVHLDSRNMQQRMDVFYYHFEGARAGQQLAQTMSDTFRAKYFEHQPNRQFNGTVSPRKLYVIDYSAPVALFAELGNIQNPFDQQRFTIINNRQAIANWLCAGFIADFENWKKENKK